MTIDAITAYSATGSDICETLEPDVVEPGVEVAELLFASAETGVVEKGDDGGEDGSGGGGAAGEAHLVVDDDRVAVHEFR